MNIGGKIRTLRMQNGLTQEELADRSELTKGFISQVERGLTSPSIATLVDILECLGTNLKDFFNETSQEKIVFHKDDFFTKEHEELNNIIEWIVPNSQKNMMEPIMVTLSEGGTTDVHNPHRGEEFGYVLAGVVCIHLGKQKFKARKGESFYFEATKEHFISNIGKTKANILWVSTPPTF